MSHSDSSSSPRGLIGSLRSFPTCIYSGLVCGLPPRLNNIVCVFPTLSLLLYTALSTTLTLSPRAINKVSRNCDSLLSLLLPAAFGSRITLPSFVARVSAVDLGSGGYTWDLGAYSRCWQGLTVRWWCWNRPLSLLGPNCLGLQGSGYGMPFKAKKQAREPLCPIHRAKWCSLPVIRL